MQMLDYEDHSKGYLWSFIFLFYLNSYSYAGLLKLKIVSGLLISLSLDALESCSPEEVFLFRLTRLNPTEKKVVNLFATVVQEALASRRSATINLMKYVLDMITSRRAKNERLVFALQGNLSSEGYNNTLLLLSCLYFPCC